MARFYEISQHDASIHLRKVKDVFTLLAKSDVYTSGFSTDKDAIAKVFSLTSECTKNNILARLTLIDSMYSTQMNRRYYALDELADVLVKLAGGKEGKLEQMFRDLAASPEENIHQFDYQKGVDGEEPLHKNLFSECYGIGKDGSDKGVAISLISKYAYFETGYNFPIYDSIACEMYPLVWHYCGFGKSPKLIYNDKDCRVIGDKTMVEYVKAINLLIGSINCRGLNYDLLDRFLWFVGKIRRGNLSLVLSREDYEKTMQIYPPVTCEVKSRNGGTKTSTEYFNIEKVDLDELDYLKRDTLLLKFFELAKFYGCKK